MNVRQESYFRRFALWTVASLLFVAGLVSTFPTTAADRLIPFEEVKAIVKENLAKRPGYQAGDLLTKRDVQPILAQLARKGFNVEAGAVGFDPYLPDNHYMVGLFRTSKGTETMRQIAHLPHAFDHLERLGSFPEGQKILRQIILESKGIAPIETLCTPEGMHEVEVQFGSQPSCKNFALHSGRVFHEESFLSHLQTVHSLAENKLTRPGE